MSVWSAFRAHAALLATLGVPACSIAFDPERYDDVPRCTWDDDCPAPADPRYEHVCTVDESYEDPSFPKICSPRAAVSCDPDDYAYESTFMQRSREAKVRRDRYAAACPELGGVQGCPPGDTGCDPGLVMHPASGRCDDEDEDTPPAIGPEEVVSGQDVLDQFCRSVYCDQSFVCHVGTRTCMPCVLGNGLGNGGCGDLYPGGQRSSVYLDPAQMDAACQGPEGDPEDAAIGPFEDIADPEADGGSTSDAAP